MTRKHGRKLWIGMMPLLVLALGAIGFACYFFHEATRPYERNALADIEWRGRGEPHVVSCLVLDAQDQPLPNAIVSICSNSGWTSEETPTDSRGLVKLFPSENDVMGIKVNEKCIMTRPYAYWLGNPSASRGLDIIIHLKFELVPSSRSKVAGN